MSNKRRPANSAAARARRRADTGSTAGAKRSSGTTWLIVGVVVAIGAALIIAISVGGLGSTSTSTTSSADTASVVRAVTAVPATTRAEIGRGAIQTMPAKVDAPGLTADGKPLVLFVGAEYCPYCAAERWPLVEALSRFGTFTGLQLSHSSSTDVYPSTNTLSFLKASYRSDHLAFQSVELRGNELQGGNYPVLQALTAEQQKVFTTYNAPPYVPAASAGSIPFVDFGGRYLISGASYDPGILQGKSALEIARAMKDPNSAIAKAATGTANVLTAVLCQLTNGQPGSVCQAEPIPTLQQQLT